MPPAQIANTVPKEGKSITRDLGLPSPTLPLRFRQKSCLVAHSSRQLTSFRAVGV